MSKEKNITPAVKKEEESLFVTLVDKFTKENNATEIEKARKNAKYLKPALSAKVAALEAKKQLALMQLDEAQENLLKAKGYNTKDVDLWLDSVRDQEERLEIAQNLLQDITHSMKTLKEYISEMF